MMKCKHCGKPTNERNPSGTCDHLFYPYSCKVCEEAGYTVPKLKEVSGWYLYSVIPLFTMGLGYGTQIFLYGQSIATIYSYDGIIVSIIGLLVGYLSVTIGFYSWQAYWHNSRKCQEYKAQQTPHHIDLFPEAYRKGGPLEISISCSHGRDEHGHLLKSCYDYIEKNHWEFEQLLNKKEQKSTLSAKGEKA